MNRAKNYTVKLIGLLLLGLTVSAYGVSDKQRMSIEERITPAGKVCLRGDKSCAVAVAAGGGAAKSPADIYNGSCMACHATGAAGAPKVGDVADWTARVEKGLEKVYANAINGVNGMPAKGLCMSCSDTELKAVVDYMVKNSK